MAKISVIVPVYNVEKYLARCIDSILSQNYSDFELILIDDGSTDESSNICDSYKRSDDRVVVIHMENSGVSKARNTGIEWALNNSDSEWITFIDSDDWINENYLLFLLRACEEMGVLTSICNDFATNGSLRIPEVGKYSVSLKNPDQVYFESGIVAPMRKLHKKELFKNVRFPVGKRHEDEYVTYKVLFFQNNIACVDNVLYYYYLRNDSFMRASWSPARLDSIDAYKEQIIFFEQKDKQEVLVKIIHNFSQSLYQNYLDARENNYPKEARLCQKELKALIKKYNKMFSIKEYPHIYEVAFPKRVAVYWSLKGIVSRFVKD